MYSRCEMGLTFTYGSGHVLYYFFALSPFLALPLKSPLPEEHRCNYSRSDGPIVIYACSAPGQCNYPTGLWTALNAIPHMHIALTLIWFVPRSIWKIYLKINQLQFILSSSRIIWQFIFIHDLFWCDKLKHQMWCICNDRMNYWST